MENALKEERERSEVAIKKAMEVKLVASLMTSRICIVIYTYTVNP